jgi:hypothetical protein
VFTCIWQCCQDALISFTGRKSQRIREASLETTSTIPASPARGGGLELSLQDEGRSEQAASDAEPSFAPGTSQQPLLTQADGTSALESGPLVTQREDVGLSEVQVPSSVVYEELHGDGTQPEGNAAPASQQHKPQAPKFTEGQPGAETPPPQLNSSQLIPAEQGDRQNQSSVLSRLVLLLIIVCCPRHKSRQGESADSNSSRQRHDRT